MNQTITSTLGIGMQRAIIEISNYIKDSAGVNLDEFIEEMEIAGYKLDEATAETVLIENGVRANEIWR